MTSNITHKFTNYRSSSLSFSWNRSYAAAACIGAIIYLLKYDSLGVLGLLKNAEFLQEFGRTYLNKSVNIWRNSSLQKFMLASVHPMGIPSIISAKRLHADNPASHFLPSFSRIMAKGYSPTSEDILSVRIPTSG